MSECEYEGCATRAHAEYDYCARHGGRDAPDDGARVRNAKCCRICGGSVDRTETCFECVDCGAIGDLITGIMDPRVPFGGDNG